ncbi:discoidin domain-containing protein [uncultured Chitinophaga sp.]|uniref:discoidin domain-containing protein n=1 Tax=uncultured Chitinophaga sp. TaxID=339340 RepID=UPI0025D7874A|nr:discoidin domain-containing protein [uncultured Chitinophaga sp.]
MMIKSTKVRALLVLGMLLFSLASCDDDKNERTYELLPPNAEEELDMTEVGTLSVNVENGSGPTGGEGSPKLVDKSVDTKFLINPYRDTLWMELNLLASQRIDAYTMSSGDDTPARDPKNWVLRGSKDRVTWVDLDTQVDQVFPTRKLTKRYDFTNATEYKYYRLYITANAGNSLFQMSEWRIIRKPLP